MPLTFPQRFSLRRFTQGEMATTSAINLDHRRIFILPSRSGLVLALVILLMLIASINYNNSMGFIFTFLLASAAQVSSFYGFKNLSGLTIQAIKSDPCFLGEKAHYKLSIKEKEGRERWAIYIQLGDQVECIKNLKPNQVITLTIPVKPKKRGWFSADTITFFSYFPLSLFRAWSPLRFDQKILVYPTPSANKLPLPIISIDKAEGNSISVQQGSDDFEGFRHYQQGDPYRRINWKALAAGKGVFIKQFTSPLADEVSLNWSSCHANNTEQKLSQLCEWVIKAQQDGLSYSLKIPSSSYDANQGIQHQLRCLKALALYK